MKEKIFNIIFCLALFFSLILIFQNNQEVAQIIINALNLFFNKVFPSLFPMFIINDLLIALNIPYYFYILFNQIFKIIFKTKGIGAYVFIMSLISGTPSSAYILKNLLTNNLITLNEANHFLYFTYFSNPLFLSLMLSLIFDSKIVLKIILIHYLSNLIIGILIRNKAPQIKETKLLKNNSNLSLALIKSINRSISTLLMILGTIVFYMLVSYLISYNISNNFLQTLIGGFLEITNGLNLLTNLNTNIIIKEIIAISFISFGGLSINTQIKAILEDTNMNFKCFFKGRIMQTIISIILIILTSIF